MGLREEKAALLRIKFCQELEKQVQSRSFEEVKVTDLCEKVDVSKVTFFKYFESKEELLRYFHRVWCLKVSSLVHSKNYKGLNGLNFLLEKLIRGVENVPSLFYSYYGYLLRIRRVKAPFSIPVVERKLILDVDYDDFEIKSIQQLIEAFILDAILSKELNSGDHTKISHFVYTYLVGIIIRSGMNNRPPDYVEVRQDLSDILNRYK